MLKPRVIPIILIADGRVVKTRRFRKPKYVGDPMNTVKIFSDLGADEIMILDIEASVHHSDVNLVLAERLAKKCTVPLGFGGGIRNVESARRLISIGCEKVVINTVSFENSEVIGDLAGTFGSQAVVGCVDYISSKSKVTSHGGRVAHDRTPVDRVRELENFGVGEILLTSIENEGSFSGLDLETAITVTRNTDLPVILNGGIGTSAHISEGIEKAEASAIGIGSYFVFQNESREVVLHYESYLRSK